MTGTWHLLPAPATWPDPDKRAFVSLARILAFPPVDSQVLRTAVDARQRRDQLGLGAAAHLVFVDEYQVLGDLAHRVARGLGDEQHVRLVLGHALEP